MSVGNKQSFTITTHSIQVTVQPWFIEQQAADQDAQPEADPAYIFGYEVMLHNLSSDTFQLLSRYWKITDSTGEITHLEGPGVVGKQPIVHPDEQYSYQSWTQLNSPLGTMEGHYKIQFLDQDQQSQISIPCFTLSVPKILN